MIKIDNLKLENLRNGAHFEFHSSTIQRAKANSTVNTQFEKFLTPYNADFQLEDKALKVSQKSFLTDDIVKVDDLRKNLYLTYRKMVKAMLDYPIENMASAAKVLAQNIKDYNIDPNGQMDLETGLLHNMLTDLKGDLAEQVELLNLTPVIEQLEIANTKMRELLEERNTAYAERKVGAMRESRAKVDEDYRKFIQVVNAYILMEEDEEVISFAKKQNAAILRYRQIIGQTSGNKKPDEGGDEPTPEPETPAITAVYQKEGGDPENPHRIGRDEQTMVEYQGFTLKGQNGTLEHVIGLVNDQDYIEWIKPETITNVTDTSFEFTMVPDLTEGQYKVRIETYDGGSPLVVEYPEMITLW